MYRTSKPSPKVRKGQEHKVGGSPDDRLFAVARLGAQLSRENAGRYAPLNEIARHAAALVDAAFKARAVLERGKSAGAHFDAARAVAHLYYANVVERADLTGPVLGLKFSSSQFSGGDENIYFVA